MPRIFSAQAKDRTTIWRFDRMTQTPAPSANSRRPMSGRNHPMVAIMQEIATARGVPPRAAQENRHYDGIGVPEDMQ